MDIDEIRDKIATSLNMDCHWEWVSILENAEPGPYCLWDVDFYIDLNGVWVNVPERTFTFGKRMLAFSARLHGSSDEDGIDNRCKIMVSGNGTFEFVDSGGVRVTNFKINEVLDLYGDDCKMRVIPSGSFV